MTLGSNRVGKRVCLNRRRRPTAFEMARTRIPAGDIRAAAFLYRLERRRHSGARKRVYNDFVDLMAED